VRKGNIELLHGKLERFVFLQGETTQAMFDRIMSLVNHIRGLRSTEWDDNKVTRKMLRTYRSKNNMLASMIMERPGYDEMTPQEVLLKLKHHECLDEDAINAHNQNLNAMGYNKNAALKATQAHEGKSSSQEKKKKVKDDFSSEKEESDKDVALIIRNFRKFIKKKSNHKTYSDAKRRNKKRFCYGCGQIIHFIADCPNEKKKHKHDKDEDKNNKGKKRGEAYLGEEWESDDSDSRDDEKKKKKGATNIAIHHSLSPTMIFPDSTSPPKLFPNISSSPRLFSNLIDNEYYTPTCLMSKGEKVHDSPDPSSDEYDSCDENIEEIKATMIKKFGKKVFTKIKMLMKKIREEG
jgi:hypothetical protein